MLRFAVGDRVKHATTKKLGTVEQLGKNSSDPIVVWDDDPAHVWVVKPHELEYIGRLRHSATPNYSKSNTNKKPYKSTRKVKYYIPVDWVICRPQPNAPEVMHSKEAPEFAKCPGEHKPLYRANREDI